MEKDSVVGNHATRFIIKYLRPVGAVVVPVARDPAIERKFWRIACSILRPGDVKGYP